ncbi:MAG: CoA pyrophosphatase [Pseudomonadales bacterium]|nr:CoA pyrophosphatase [Pseudomonadales bacterium]
MITLSDIRTAINDQDHEPAIHDTAASQASVAVIIAEGKTDLEICFIRRSERDDDPWSGHVAFPGGRVETGDLCANTVAERETREEIGIHLVEDHRIGPLPIRQVARSASIQNMVLSPFIYHVGPRDLISTSCDPMEVADVFWVPVKQLFDKESISEHTFNVRGSTIDLPGIKFGDHIIWGLTLRILGSFADIMGYELPVTS